MAEEKRSCANCKHKDNKIFMMPCVECVNVRLSKWEAGEYTEADVLAAAQYGFRYAFDSQNDGKEVPKGNVLQWLYVRTKKKGYVLPTQQ